MSDPETRKDKYRLEYSRQVGAYSAAIDQAFNEAGKLFECPLVNALAAAIVIAEARLLASVPAEHREALLTSMNNFRPEAYAEYGPTMRTETIFSKNDGELN
ncbi:hypothetical protein ACNT8L_04640 [Brucella intermedia]|uniref:hypothetical protein n=1 Tax=Brucella intermedia TaxID=94625 RepID=UPI003AB4C88E